MDLDSYMTPQAEQLLIRARTRYAPSDAARRALITEGVAAVTFLIGASTLALLAPAPGSPTALSVIVTAAVFMVAARVTFPVGSAFTRPTQLAFVPMLFVLPPSIVPLVVSSCLVLDLLPELHTGVVPIRRALARIGDSFYALGPALVLAFAHDHGFAWRHWPVLIAAFAAQMTFDLAAGLARTWFADRIVPARQTQMLWLYVVDGCLVCVGLAIAASAVRTPALTLLALPLIGLLGVFARDRQERVEHMLALSTAYRGTALLLSDVIDDSDEYTGVHSREVVDLSLGVARRLGLGTDVRRHVEFGALLHDVGKIRVPRSIIQKPGKLDDAEWEVMRQHTIYGEQMLSPVGGVLSRVGTIVRASHERYDGTGYPDSLAGEEIPIEARIISACDAFNAMTTDRCYRSALSVGAATAELIRGAGTQFDPGIVEALLAEIRSSPLPGSVRVPEPSCRAAIQARPAAPPGHALGVDRCARSPKGAESVQPSLTAG
ncbi:MAG: HD-GYP domain-containing protein [Solirubrobacteraceae bacterium]